MAIPYAEVIGDPIGHSKSPVIHNYWLSALRIGAEYRPIQVRAGELGDYLSSRRADPSWKGCNVTMPHKLDVLQHLDELEADAARAGSVNTVINGENRLIGLNTDVQGFAEPVAGLLWKRHPGRSAIIGSGGAARAVLLALQHWKIEDIVVMTRNRVKAAEMLTSLGAKGTVLPIDSKSLMDANFVINASPLGMTGQPPLDLKLDFICEDEPVIYDLVYSPLKTGLLAAAEDIPGAHRIDGLQMLVAQAARAFSLFFDRPAPRSLDAQLRVRLQS